MLVLDGHRNIQSLPFVIIPSAGLSEAPLFFLHDGLSRPIPLLLLLAHSSVILTPLPSFSLGCGRFVHI